MGLKVLHCIFHCCFTIRLVCKSASFYYVTDYLFSAVLPRKYAGFILWSVFMLFSLNVGKWSFLFLIIYSFIFILFSVLGVSSGIKIPFLLYGGFNVWKTLKGKLWDHQGPKHCSYFKEENLQKSKIETSALWILKGFNNWKTLKGKLSRHLGPKIRFYYNIYFLQNPKFKISVCRFF